MPEFRVTVVGGFYDALDDDARGRVLTEFEQLTGLLQAPEVGRTRFWVRLLVPAKDADASQWEARKIVARPLLDAGYTLATSWMTVSVMTAAEA